MSHPEVRAAAADAARTLRDARIAPHALGEYQPPRKRLLGTRPARICRIGAVWRLGVLLLTTDGTLLAAGATLRAHEPPRILGYTSESARARDELRHAAIRGGLAEGEVVDYDATELGKLSERSFPVALRDGMPVVRWTATAPLAAARPLRDYLAERISLLSTAER